MGDEDAKVRVRLKIFLEKKRDNDELLLPYTVVAKYKILSAKVTS
jgi:hypothetical protein